LTLYTAEAFVLNQSKKTLVGEMLLMMVEEGIERSSWLLGERE